VQHVRIIAFVTESVGDNEEDDCNDAVGNNYNSNNNNNNSN
jgi:hypothetical protein